MKHKAVFIDKDGTLIKDVPYNVNPDRIRLQAGAAFFLTRMRQAGYRSVMVTNQSGIAYGYFTESDFMNAVKRIEELAGNRFDKILYCPHHPEGRVAPFAIKCSCRKPAPSLLIAAAAADRIDLARSWMIGDILDDVEAGNRAGCRTILLNNGGESEWRKGPCRTPDFIVTDLFQAAFVILNEENYEPDVHEHDNRIPAI